MLGAYPRPLTHSGLCQDSQDSQHIVAITPKIYYNDKIRSHSTSIRGKDTLGRVWRNLPIGFVYFPCQPRTGTPGVLPFLTVKTQWHICNVSLREAHLRLRVQDFYWERVMQAFPKPQSLRRKQGFSAPRGQNNLASVGNFPYRCGERFTSQVLRCQLRGQPCKQTLLKISDCNVNSFLYRAHKKNNNTKANLKPLP